jgi:predicted DNA-binding protein
MHPRRHDIIVAVEDSHAMTIRITGELYERLRRQAFEHRVSQSEIVREGIESRVAELEAAVADAR